MRELLDESYAGNKQFFHSHSLLDELHNLGLEQVIISPGSRSTPLVLAAVAHPAIKTTVIIDERSAAFFALGYARVNRKPIALICTSGTAAAHYLPAIIESRLQHLPLIALTADRPLALRNSGANQTINQDQLFGEHANFCSLNLFDDNSESIDVGLQNLCSLLQKGGPLQCNIHFDKPLEPTHDFFHSIAAEAKANTKEVSSQIFSYFEQESILPRAWQTKIATAERAVFVAGPANDPSTYAELYEQLAKQNIPIIAEQSSGYSLLTNENTTASHAFTFLGKEQVQQALKPDLILSSGQSPTHKSTLNWLAMHKDVPQIHFNGFLKDVQNGLLKERFLPIKGKLAYSQNQVLNFPKTSGKWIESWKKKEREFSQKKVGLLDKQLKATVTEPSFYYFLTKIDSSISTWCLGNSLVARDYDLFKYTDKHKKSNQLFTTRGASGIDGLIAQAAGTALATKKKVGLIIGDVSFQHDIGSLDLLAKNPNISLHIYVINNQGGRIFDRLPIKSFETLLLTYYYTKAAGSVQKLAESFAISYTQITTNKQLVSRLNSPNLGSHISEIIVDLPLSEMIRNSYQS
jgi:2-succinyl-5-enolpyruvyl-6-hydroxy-3-cyclohexene-1-carboxylate synthase